ncbi:MAG: Arc family DNA-binding protein [Chromatiaceae bacterium]
MASVLIKNLPDELHQQLKLRAQRHHRSLNKELIALIEAAVTKEGIESGQAQDAEVQRQLTAAEERRIARIRALRGKYRDAVSSSEEFAARKAEEIALER